MTRRTWSSWLLTLVGLVTLAGTGLAQGLAPDAGVVPKAVQDLNAARQESDARENAAARQVIPLQVQLVISKMQGEKKISSLPYVLSVNTGTNANATSSIRMGTQVPIMTSAPDGKSGQTHMYRDVGTNIDCGAIARADGSFVLNLTVSDSSVALDDKTVNVATLPILRNFQTTNRLVLRDGQSTEFTAATDPASGQVIRVSATLKVLK